MAGDSITRALRRTIQALEVELPEKIAENMYQETMDNFDNEGYGNDGHINRWDDRYGPSGNVESLLRYPKLNYTGELKGSITYESGRGFAQISSSSPKAATHNEGLRGSGGDPMRVPPASSQPVRLGTDPVKRQFMGVGERTYEQSVEAAEKVIKKYL